MKSSDFKSSMFGKMLWVVRPEGWAVCPACGSSDSVAKSKDCPLCLGGELWGSVAGGEFTNCFKDQINQFHFVSPCILTAVDRTETVSGSNVLCVWVDMGAIGTRQHPLKVTNLDLLFEDEAEARSLATFLNYKAIGETLSLLPMRSVVGYLKKKGEKL